MCSPWKTEGIESATILLDYGRRRTDGRGGIETHRDQEIYQRNKNIREGLE